MYLDFYQLKKAPFNLTPDPEFLFLSLSHKAALGAIIHGIEAGYGLIAITGEVGVGKTTVIRAYMERANRQRFKTIYIANANVSFRALLKTVLREFGVDADADEPFDMVNRLHQILLEEHARGRKVALIIDEAQNMPLCTLQDLRVLSNLETPTEKLLQVVFVGQPELQHKLNLRELRHLKQRVVLRVTIEPLTDEQSLAYIYHRLAKVATTLEPIFTQGALRLIVATAKGTPRVLSTLCTNALIAGYGYRQNPVTSRTVREVINHAGDARKPRRLRRSPAWALVLVVCVGVVGLSRGKLKDEGGAYITSPTRPQQIFTEPQRGFLQPWSSDTTVKDNPRTDHVGKPAVISAEEGRSQTGDEDSKNRRAQEGTEGANPVEQPLHGNDTVEHQPGRTPMDRRGQNHLLSHHSW